MKRFLKTRPSPAMVVALIALFVSLGGVSYGVATGSIDSREIKNGTVRNKDVHRNTLTGSRIRESTLRRVRRALRADRLQHFTPQELQTRGFVGVRQGVVGFTGGYTPIASLALPAGRYLIIAKAQVSNTASSTLTAACRLLAGGDRDETRTKLEPGNSAGRISNTALMIPHIATGAFTARFQCRAEGSPGLNLFRDPPFTQAAQIKIAAVRTDTMETQGQ